MDWMETNGVVLRYELSGTGHVPLLLIHELGGSLEFWDPVLPTLQQAFHVLRFDLRGFGMSEKVKILRLDDLLGDIAGLLDALAITHPCDVVGPALGAGIALAFAARYPDRVLTEMDLTQQYGRITCPTLVIGCTYDTIRPPHEVKAIAQQIPGARYVETASGHFMPHQTPELFLETVLPFLQES
jgi:pimeloyl-ACP methyl ester carboxylesterase